MTRLSDTALKIIYGLFILWLGTLAPLVYVDQFATSHQIQPYRFALFSGHKRLLAPALESAELQLWGQLTQRLTGQQDTISASSPFAGLAHSLQWSLGQLYLFAGLAGLLLLLFGRLGLTGRLAADSAELPPPEKPPPLT